MCKCIHAYVCIYMCMYIVTSDPPRMEFGIHLIYTTYLFCSNRLKPESSHTPIYTLISLQVCIHVGWGTMSNLIFYGCGFLLEWIAMWLVTPYMYSVHVHSSLLCGLICLWQIQCISSCTCMWHCMSDVTVCTVIYVPVCVSLPCCSIIIIH